MEPVDKPPLKDVLKPPQRKTLIFCIGPVLELDTREKADNKLPHKTDLSIWSKNLPKAGVLLYAKDNSIRFVALGGKTGGERNPAESQIVSADMEQSGVPAGKIERGMTSKYTLDNLVEYANGFTDRNGSVIDEEIDVLATSFHLPRVEMYLDLFAIPVKNRFKTEEILLYKARLAENMKNSGIDLTSDDSKWDRETLIKISQMVDINTNTNTFYADQKGDERQPYADRFEIHDLAIREVLEYPQQVLTEAARVENNNRMTAMVAIAYKVYGSEKMKSFDLNLADSPDIMRAKLKNIVWPPPQHQGDAGKREASLWKEQNRTGTVPKDILRRMKRVHRAALEVFEQERKYVVLGV